MSDEAGLFDDAPVVHAGVKRASEANAGERRTKLKMWDSTCSQMLNPYGSSISKYYDVQKLWDTVSKGSKVAVYHSELAAGNDADGIYRQGVGLSRFAESMLASIDALKEPNISKLLKDAPLQAALADAAAIEPSLRILNQGKGSQSSSDAVGFQHMRAAAARAAAGHTGHTDKEVSDAASTIHDWLSKETTPLRAILAIMGSHGAFWTGHVNEKVARGWVVVKKTSKEQTRACALARKVGFGATNVVPDDEDAKGLL